MIAPLMPLAPGTKLGPYEIGAPLGAGGMGEVYPAKDTRLDRKVAAITGTIVPASRIVWQVLFGVIEIQ